MELVLPKNYELVSEYEAKQIIGGGKAGFRIYISPEVRSMGAIAGGAAAAAAVGAATWKLAALGPAGAAAAAGLPTLAAGIVGYAIEHNWKFCDVAIDIPGDDRLVNLNV